MDLGWLKDVNPSWYFVLSLACQAIGGAWFLRGLKADRDRIIEDVADGARRLAAHAATLDRHELALGLQGGKIGDLEVDFGKINDLVLVRMPSHIDGVIKRAELRYQKLGRELAAAEQKLEAQRSGK